jgi:hypothetical protein
LRVVSGKSGGTCVRARWPWTGESRRLLRLLNA